MSDFVMVGRLKLSTDHEIVAGVRPDTGEVQVHLNGPRDHRSLGIPPVDFVTAQQWAALITKAASAAVAIQEAHEHYQAALAAALGKESTT